MNYNPRMTFYTRRGDDGTTGLLGKGRVPKFHLRIEALGTLDESTATLGLARASVHDPRSAPLMLNVQRDLYRLMAEVAAAPEHADQFRFDEGRVQWIEEQTDLLSKTVEMPNEFIIPGDSIGGASLSLARAVVRRAERRVAEPPMGAKGVLSTRSPRHRHKVRVTADAGRQSISHTVNNAYDEHEGIS